MDDDFKPIPQFQFSYEINSSGEVRSLKFGSNKVLKRYEYKGKRFVLLKGYKNKVKRFYIEETLKQLFNK